MEVCATISAALCVLFVEVAGLSVEYQVQHGYVHSSDLGQLDGGYSNDELQHEVFKRVRRSYILPPWFWAYFPSSGTTDEPGLPGDISTAAPFDAETSASTAVEFVTPDATEILIQAEMAVTPFAGEPLAELKINTEAEEDDIVTATSAYNSATVTTGDDSTSEPVPGTSETDGPSVETTSEPDVEETTIVESTPTEDTSSESLWSRIVSFFRSWFSSEEDTSSSSDASESTTSDASTESVTEI